MVDVFGSEVRVFDWLSDWPASTTVLPGEEDGEAKPLLWWHAFDPINLFCIEDSPPLLIGDEIRFIIPTQTAICGIIIPLNSQRLDEDIRVEILAKGDWITWSAEPRMHYWGYHRGVFVDRSHNVWHTIDYAWSDETAAWTHRPEAPKTRTIPYSKRAGDGELILLDQYSNRVLIVENNHKVWFDIQLPTTL